MSIDDPKANRKEERTESQSLTLHYVDESSVSEMTCGDIFLIESPETTNPEKELTFRAILACPLCGKQILISAAQYSGLAPVSCGSPACPGLFRIADRRRIIRLPVN